MIVFGLRKFGWVDEIEGLGTVATTFFHLMFIPLFPIETHLVLGGNRGLKLPMSVKSVLVAWIRSGLFWSAAASWFFVPASFGVSCLTALPLTIAYFGMPLLVRKASPARAEAIRRSLSS